VPRDNLLFYVEFDGLDIHAAKWQRTAAYKMLNSTPLGVMLEEVATQLLDRAMNQMPSQRLSGADVVRLVKMMAHKGCVLALNADQNSPNPFVGTLVLRSASTKENKALSSRMLGFLMGPSPKPRIERQEGRVLVHVPRGPSPDSGWVWWSEKDDLVIGFMQPSNATSILGALDGRAPSTALNPLIRELAQPEGNFTPILRAFIDPGASPPALGLASMGMPQPRLTVGLSKLKTATGIDRIDYRWGFNGDSLQSITRLVAPAPRKNMLAIFDQPPMKTGELIPLPDGAGALVAVSVSPSKVLETLGQTASAAGIKQKLDELAEKLWTHSRIDLEKDLLRNLGPKMEMYMAPDRSAHATDEGAGLAARVEELTPTAVISSLQRSLPMPTLVAELKDPAAFGRALDALVLEVNKALKAKAIEKAAEEAAHEPAAGAGGPGPFAPAPVRGPGRLMAGVGAGEGSGSGGRTPRRRGSRETLAPEFRLMPGQTKTYFLFVSPDASWKIVPPGVRPTIRIEGKYVVFASTHEAARVALETVRKKAWKPSADVEKALSRLPDRPMLIALADPRESDPGLLASLPGTLQARINSVIAMSVTKTGTPGAVPDTIASPAVAGGPVGGLLSEPRMRRSRVSRGGERSARGGVPAGYPGLAGHSDAPGGPGGISAGSQENWIQLKVDPTHLPKAEDLKDLMFPGTLAVVADEQSIRLVTRESFPNLYASAVTGAVVLSLALPAIQTARARDRCGPNVQPGGMAPGQLGPGLPATGQGSFPGAVPGAAGATAPAPAGAAAPGPFGPSRLGQRGPGNRGPG
jgi:hypothetical protein